MTNIWEVGQNVAKECLLIYKECMNIRKGWANAFKECMNIHKE